jgi:hypothetical protein
MTRFLWAIEERKPPEKQWHLLPNTVQVRRYHCAHDIKGLREDYPAERYRIVKYERLK